MGPAESNRGSAAANGPYDKSWEGRVPQDAVDPEIDLTEIDDLSVHQADIDPDLDPGLDSVPPRRRAGTPWRAVAVVAVGGALGALARYGIDLALPTPAGGFPVATFLINVTGCLLIGVLMVLVSEVFTTRPLLRPFVGVGILGGYTTFSTYANDMRGLLRPGSLPVAFAYLAGTLVAALLAVFVGMILTRLALRRRTS